jgi:phospholipid/cholesterol/gamma-HCH transport system substrate-binding protein
MPIETKVKWARLRVGLMAITAMLILAVLIFLITGETHLFQSNAEIFTYLNDSAALAEGAPVYLNGIPVGQVKKIMLSGSYDPRRVVKIDMQIPEDKLSSIPVDSEASISAANVLGTKYINIKKGMSKSTVKPGQEIPSLNTAEFEDVVQQGYAVLASLQETIKRMDRIVGSVENGKGSIGKLLVDDTLYNHVLQVVDEAAKVAKALSSDKGTFGKLLYDPQMYNDLRGSLTRVDKLLQGLQEGQGTAGKLLKDPSMYNEAQKTVADVHKLVTDINDGKGTVGKLLKSEDLHKQIQATIARLDLLMDKVNSGQGTLGQLLVNSSLYDNLNGTTREMNGLMKDFRANPKKFLRIKLAIF